MEQELGNGDTALGTEILLNGGFNIRTTIDSNLEAYVERAVTRHLTQPELQLFPYPHSATLTDSAYNVNDAAVVMNARTGEVLAMDGHVNGEPEYRDLTWVYDKNYRRLCPSIDLQRMETIGKELVSSLGFGFPKIQLEYVSAADFPGCCFYLNIPDDIRIVMLKLNGYQLLRNYLHELGHALYITHITRKEFVFRTNLGAFDEAMAMLFGGLIDLNLETKKLLPLQLQVPSTAHELNLHTSYDLRFLQQMLTLLSELIGSPRLI